MQFPKKISKHSFLKIILSKKKFNQLILSIFFYNFKFLIGTEFRKKKFKYTKSFHINKIPGELRRKYFIKK